MYRRLAVLAFMAAAFALVPAANAGEKELAGIRLDQLAMELLDQKPYGPPHFFGPIGTVITYGVEAPAQPTAPAARRATAPVGFGITGTAGGRREEGGERAALLETLRGLTASGTVTPAGAARAPARPTVASQAQTGTQMYWLYNLGGGTRVVVGMDARGRVRSITVSGTSYAGAVTERGVCLGERYMSVVDKYGFPDSTSGSGGDLNLVYQNAGLTLTLANLRVNSITLAQPGQAATAPRGVVATARPTTAQPGAATVPAQMGELSPAMRERLERLLSGGRQRD